MHREAAELPALEVVKRRVDVALRFSGRLGTAGLMVDSIILKVFCNLNNSTVKVLGNL